jgi:hypothetical protein
VRWRLRLLTGLQKSGPDADFFAIRTVVADLAALPPTPFLPRVPPRKPMWHEIGYLAELQAMLPPGLTQLVRQPADPPEVVEIWFSP